MSERATVCVWRASWPSGDHLLVALVLARYADEIDGTGKLTRRAVSRLTQLTTERVDQIMGRLRMDGRIVEWDRGYRITMTCHISPETRLLPARSSDFHE